MPQRQLEAEEDRDMGEEGDESLRSLSMERFSGEGERRDGSMGDVVALEGSGRGPCRAWRHEVVICLHKCADIVYVGDMLMVVFWVGRFGCGGGGDSSENRSYDAFAEWW